MHKVLVLKTPTYRIALLKLAYLHSLGKHAMIKATYEVYEVKHD